MKALRALLSSMSDGLEESLEESFEKSQIWDEMFPGITVKEVYMRGAKDFIVVLMDRLDKMEKEEAEE